MSRDPLEGWTEESWISHSDDIPRYLRIMRLQGVLHTHLRAERCTLQELIADMLAIVEHLTHSAPLPGQPVRLDPPEEPR